MTESQQLLRDYVKHGSELAFRELVGRYVHFVYGTARRLVHGDSQLAEEVCQAVFIGLAREGKRLSTEIALGGWLHRRTFHLATKAARGERRRRDREQAAAAMSSPEQNPDEIGAAARPILDEALRQLNDGDRQAVFLRFFEQRGFRDVGAALQISEDAARMRVGRALEKMRAILCRSGVEASSAALSTVLEVEAGQLAPAGLASKLAGGALSVAAASGAAPPAFFHLMNVTKLKTAVAGAVVAASITTSLILQQHAAAEGRDLDASLREQTALHVKLASQKNDLTGALARAGEARAQSDELRKLRADAPSWRAATNGLAALRQEQHSLRAERESRIRTPLQKAEESRARVMFVRDFLTAAMRYENKLDRAPGGFDEAAPFLAGNSDAATNIFRDDFEWVYHLPDTTEGTMQKAGADFHDLLAVRQIEPVQDENGRWTKVYGFIDGLGQILTMPCAWKGVTYQRFEDFERAHITTPPPP